MTNHDLNVAAGYTPDPRAVYALFGLKDGKIFAGLEVTKCLTKKGHSVTGVAIEDAHDFDPNEGRGARYVSASLLKQYVSGYRMYFARVEKRWIEIKPEKGGPAKRIQVVVLHEAGQPAQVAGAICLTTNTHFLGGMVGGDQKFRSRKPELPAFPGAVLSTGYYKPTSKAADRFLFALPVNTMATILFGNDEWPVVAAYCTPQGIKALKTDRMAIARFTDLGDLDTKNVELAKPEPAATPVSSAPAPVPTTASQEVVAEEPAHQDKPSATPSQVDKFTARAAAAKSKATKKGSTSKHQRQKAAKKNQALKSLADLPKPVEASK